MGDWLCAFTNSDGNRIFRSTGTKEKKQAQEICRAWDKAARLAKKSGLTPDAAREIIAAGVADVFATAMRETMPSGTVRLWYKMWLSEPPFIESTDCEC